MHSSSFLLALAVLIRIGDTSPLAPANGVQQVVQSVGQLRTGLLQNIGHAQSDAQGQEHQKQTGRKQRHKGKKKHKSKHKHHGTPSGPITSGRVRRSLKKADIISSVIDDFSPSFLLNITFPSSALSPFLGQKLNPNKLQDEPTVTLYAPDESKDFDKSTTLPLNNLVITMTDPDAPSHSDPKWSEICHWIAQGVPVNSTNTIVYPTYLASLNLKSIMPYKPPGPPPKTGKHRYIILAFTPKNGTTELLDLVKPGDRQHWGYNEDDDEKGVRRWAEEMGLVPIAGEYFRARHHK